MRGNNRGLRDVVASCLRPGAKLRYKVRTADLNEVQIDYSTPRSPNITVKEQFEPRPALLSSLNFPRD